MVGAPGAGGHRLRSPQRAVAIVATRNGKAAIARLSPTRLAVVRNASVSLGLRLSTYETFDENEKPTDRTHMYMGRLINRT